MGLIFESRNAKPCSPCFAAAPQRRTPGLRGSAAASCSCSPLACAPRCQRCVRLAKGHGQQSYHCWVVVRHEAVTAACRSGMTPEVRRLPGSWTRLLGCSSTALPGCGSRPVLSAEAFPSGRASNSLLFPVFTFFRVSVPDLPSETVKASHLTVARRTREISRKNGWHLPASFFGALWRQRVF